MCPPPGTLRHLRLAGAPTLKDREGRTKAGSPAPGCGYGWTKPLPGVLGAQPLLLLVRGLRSRNSARRLPLWSVPCRAWCGPGSLVTRRGAACSGWRWSLLQLLLESLGAPLAAGKMLGRSLLTWVLAAAVTCAQAQQVPPVGELQPRLRLGCRCRCGLRGRGRSCGGAGEGHLLARCTFRGHWFGPAELWVQNAPVNPGRSRFGVVWTEYTF